MWISTFPEGVLAVFMNARSGRVPDFGGTRDQVPSVSRAKVVPDSKMRVLKPEDWEAMWTSTVFVPVDDVLM
jgi:hypothetical protein